MRSKNSANPRRLVSPNLQTIEQRDVTDTAKVTVMLRPSERRSVFDRLVNKRCTSPEAEAKNYGVPRSLILQIIKLEHEARLEEARMNGYAAARRENLLPPGGGAAVIPMRRAA